MVKIQTEDLVIIDFSLDVIPQESFLYKILSGTTCVPIKRNDDNIIMLDRTASDLNTIYNYLLNGSISDLDKLIELLDYFGIFQLRSEYVAEYLAIKLKEEWYRRNLYNPHFEELAQMNEYELVELDDKILTEFKLIHKIHYIYNRYVGTPKYRKNTAKYITKDSLDDTTKVRDTEKTIRLNHTYYRPEIEIKNVNNARSNIIKHIMEANELFLERDLNFDHNILREAHIKKRRYAGYGQAIGLDYKIDHSIVMKNLKEIHDTLEGEWDNLFLAGGSVVNAILDIKCGRSDYDVFIYGLNEEDANAKIVRILSRIKATSITRSENAITIYEWSREIQIILRLYQTKAEVLYGFDVDSCCVGFDGSKVWMTPRAKYSFENMINCIDFDRMSPTYELRLAKYMKRGFSVYIPGFDQKKVLKDKIMQVHKISKLKGIDILLYNYYYNICPSYSRLKSDYAKYSRNTKLLKSFKISLDKTGKEIINICHIKYSDYKLGRRRTFKINIKNVIEIPESVIRQITDRGYKLRIPVKIQWKKINPGEQMTGTFHKLILDDISKWYQYEFYLN